MAINETTRWASSGACIACLVALGCTPPDLPGHYWDISVNTAADACNATPVQYSEDFEYRLVFDVNDVDVAIGPDVFATGTSDGCIVRYDSVTWTEQRAAGNIQWTLSGEAQAQRGDGACGISSDWIGTETFTVVTSEDPTVSPDCTYELNVTGTYVGEVE